VNKVADTGFRSEPTLRNQPDSSFIHAVKTDDIANETVSTVTEG
jgi:hypothetical protein